MSNARFRGLGHVFSFTLGQMVKSRANIVSAVILLVMALVSVPLIQLTNGHGSVGPDVPAIVEQDGLTDAQRDILSSGITVITDDIAAPDEAPADELDGADDSMDGFWVQYGYAIVVMMLCMMSTAFLLRAVVEEKESKLVELLMVSVSPLALLGGKILAVMLYVAALLLLVLLVPSVLHFSTEGPGSKHAPFFIALVIAVVVGALAQKSRLCMVGGIRDTIMLRDAHLLWGFIAIFAVVLAGNLILGNFKLGFDLQPIAHSSHLWNLLGMVLVGWGSVLLGGCPLRQLILAGSGNGDSAVTVFGMIVGAAFAHNFALAGNPDTLNDAKELVVGGIGTNGKIAVAVGFVVLLAISLINSRQKEVQA